MARMDYCRHDWYIGPGSDPCPRCVSEAQQAEANRKGHEAYIRRMAQEEIERNKSAFVRLLRALSEPIDYSDYTKEEIDEALRAEGIDPEELAKRTREKLAEIQARFPTPPTKGEEKP